MGAGVPDYQKLHAMGKLPKEARGEVPLLAQLDKAEEAIEEFKKGCCNDCREKFFAGLDISEPAPITPDEVTIQCEHCDYVAKGRTQGVAENNLRLHSKSHAAPAAPATETEPQKEEVPAQEQGNKITTP